MTYDENPNRYRARLKDELAVLLSLVKTTNKAINLDSLNDSPVFKDYVDIIEEIEKKTTTIIDLVELSCL